MSEFETPALDSAAADTVTVPDAVLSASVDVARDALLKITDAGSIGEPAGHLVHDEHVLSLLFQCLLPGYPGWHWTVTLARADETSAPTVLETELMPGENALLAPEWVPWSDRLAEYQAAQQAKDAGDTEDTDEDPDDDDDTDDEDDDDELDEEDADQLGTLHGGDIDGVDIDDIDSDDIDSDDIDDSAPGDGEVDESEDSEDDSDDVGPEPGQPVLGDEAAAEDEQ